MSIRYQIFGGNGELPGSTSYSVGIFEASVVVDCGLESQPGKQAPDIRAALRQAEAFILSHAHVDHIEGLPILIRDASLSIKDFPRTVYMNAYTHAILQQKLDAAGIVPSFFNERLRLLTAWQPIEIGTVSHRLTITPVPCPHSMAETLGFLYQYNGTSFLVIPDVKLSASSSTSALDIDRLNALCPNGLTALALSARAAHIDYRTTDDALFHYFHNNLQRHPHNRIIFVSHGDYTELSLMALQLANSLNRSLAYGDAEHRLYLAPLLQHSPAMPQEITTDLLEKTPHEKQFLLLSDAFEANSWIHGIDLRPDDVICLPHTSHGMKPELIAFIKDSGCTVIDRSGYTGHAPLYEAIDTVRRLGPGAVIPVHGNEKNRGRQLCGVAAAGLMTRIPPASVTGRLLQRLDVPVAGFNAPNGSIFHITHGRSGGPIVTAGVNPIGRIVATARGIGTSPNAPVVAPVVG